MKDTILELAELSKNISLGIFVNGSYGLLKGEDFAINSSICLITTLAMYIFIKIERRFK